MDTVVLDLEFNNLQRVPRGGARLSVSQRRERIMYPNEIIQMGAVRLDEGFREKDRLDLAIKNVFYPDLNPYVAEMTGISQERLDEGVSYAKAWSSLLSFCRGANLVTWGIGDIFELIRNGHLHKLTMEALGHEYLDLQEWLGRQRSGNRTPSLKSALQEFDLQVNESKLHDGFYDALSTARVMEAAVATYGRPEPWIKATTLFYSDCVYQPILSLKEIPDEEVSMQCPVCGEAINYDVSLMPEHAKIRCLYRCQTCNGYFLEDITARENMAHQRKFFKKIKEIKPGLYKGMVAQRRRDRSSHK